MASSPRTAVRAASVPPATWREALRLESPLLVVVASYVGAVAVIAMFSDAARPLFAAGPEAGLVVAMVALVAAGLCMLDLLREGRSMTQRETWVRFRRRVLAPATVLRFGVAATLFWPFLDVFGWMKSRIPVLRPFYLDPALVEWERVLHVGRQPWEWLWPAFGSAPMVRFLDLFYHPLYSAVVVLTVLWFALRPAGAFRMQFLLTYVLIWIVLGSVFATALSSVGPCYYGRLLPGAADPFAPLMAQLNAIHVEQPLASITAQNVLWAGVENRALALGVSAMPSVHVGIAALLMFAALRAHRVLAIVGVVFFVITLLASVVLGWHYALDGYVVLPLVGALWWATGRLSRHHFAVPPDGRGE